MRSRSASPPSANAPEMKSKLSSTASTIQLHAHCFFVSLPTHVQTNRISLHASQRGHSRVTGGVYRAEAGAGAGAGGGHEEERGCAQECEFDRRHLPPHMMSSNSHSSQLRCSKWRSGKGLSPLTIVMFLNLFATNTIVMFLNIFATNTILMTCC